MQDISNMNREGLPSSKSLFKATGVAAVIGGVVLVTTILPAEYGIDPTGLGQTMGLTLLSQANAAESTQPESESASSGNLLALPAGLAIQDATQWPWQPPAPTRRSPRPHHSRAAS